ncbi:MULTISPECIES: metal ABC transporter permease [Pseudomonas]|uniref:Manganese/iron transport system permease protein n=1 Tax=Phytopseudomonas flavescens TaxID=29435 RepID=A0A7Y9XL33_9GAMM|nr:MULTISPECIES: metal ABC transporter permease [Pseudomonas]MCW2293510.1 manganese/iron transport system permease protein [Pseudomonas sp. BIGb0408]NYH71919.1 manganese/iron transport system permease protein [Pseudomonas flavescens]
MEILLQPLQIDFMQYALLIAVLVAIPAALLSCFLVLKGWALMGDATAHAVFPGVVIAYIVGLPYSLGAFVAGMLCAVASGYLKENSRIKQDTLMGVVFSGMFGFGLLLYTQIHSDVHLDHILFGDMLGIGWADLLESGLIALAVTAFIGLKWRDLLLHAFDPVQARTVGLPVRLLHYGLLAVMSLTIVGALKAIGIVLTVALLIAPGAIAFLLTRTMGAMLFTAVGIAVGAALSGVYLSFFIDSAPGPTIVVLLSALFVVVFIHASRREHRRSAQL